MAIKFDDEVLKVRVPYVDIKIKTNADNDLMPLTVSKFSDCSIVSCQDLAWCLRIII